MSNAMLQKQLIQESRVIEANRPKEVKVTIPLTLTRNTIEIAEML